MRSDILNLKKVENDILHTNKQNIYKSKVFENNRKSVDIPSVPSVKFRRQLIDDYNNLTNIPKTETSSITPQRHKTPGRYILNKSENIYGTKANSNPPNELPRIPNNDSLSPTKPQDVNKTLDHSSMPSTRLEMQQYAQQTLSSNKLPSKGLLKADPSPKTANRLEELRYGVEGVIIGFTGAYLILGGIKCLTSKSPRIIS